MKRPLSVLLISCVFILAGITGIVYHAGEFHDGHISATLVGMLLLRALAIVGGVYALRGANWARWLLLAWIVFHAVISIYHETMQLVMHSLIALITFVALFNRRANAFFRTKG